MTRNFWTTCAALLLTAFMFRAIPASAMQILDAADHAELVAVVSDRAVSRITLTGDRVARVVRGAEGFAVEHDKARGDLYLRPLEPEAQTGKSVTFFIGTARGFTYKLSLRTVARDSAQILIRNAAATPRAERQGPSGGRVSALAALIRAVARREVPPGYVVETISGAPRKDGLSLLEIWRGRKFIARVYEADPGPGDDPETLVQGIAPGVAALWRSLQASGPSGGRLLVAVHETYTTEARDER
ncbi:MAG: type-F conjugative transfer system secretin TraK [Nitrospinae bacterium]|nr:type-F conjugative transfer system secretin TraK [Nitrospinota bacterium]